MVSPARPTGVGSDQKYMPEYEGDYLENQMHGHGRKLWKAGQFAGNSYCGGFRHDRKHGTGPQ